MNILKIQQVKKNAQNFQKPLPKLFLKIKNNLNLKKFQNITNSKNLKTQNNPKYPIKFKNHFPIFFIKIIKKFTFSTIKKIQNFKK